MNSKSVEIGKRIENLAHNLQFRPLPKRPARYAKGSLEARVAISPYAAILASPIRLCAYHQRYFPSEMLVGYGLVHEATTKKLVPVPHVERVKPQGPIGVKRYVKLNKDIFKQMKTKASRAVFMGKAELGPNTVDELSKALKDNAHKHYKPSSYVPLKSIDNSVWQSEHPDEFQCILISNDSKQFCELNHRIISDRGTSKVPCYNIGKLWGDSPSIPSAYGVPKQASTAELAIALWKCRAFFTM